MRAELTLPPAVVFSSGSSDQHSARDRSQIAAARCVRSRFVPGFLGTDYPNSIEFQRSAGERPVLTRYLATPYRKSGANSPCGGCLSKAGNTE